MARKSEKVVRLDLDQRKDEYLFTAWLDDLQVAVMRAVPEGENVLVHLNVHAWTRELCREYICCFIAIRELLRESGYKLVIACSDHADHKMKHFWRMMGFRFCEEIDLQGRTYAYAVMEA